MQAVMVDADGTVVAKRSAKTVGSHVTPVMSAHDHPPRKMRILGVTREGRPFRPSDWAERLAGVMSPFRPGGAHGGPGAHIGYSPYCVPTFTHGARCVLVNERLREIEPMAWDFVMHFARDNDLQVEEVV